MQFWQTSLLLAVAGAGTLTSALPRNNNPLTARSECPAGTSYYACYQSKFYGCCSVDACAATNGCPDDTTTPPPTTCTPGQKTRVFLPEMKVVYDGTAQPTIGKDIYLEPEAGQQLTFKLPADAKKCDFGWSVPEERQFTVSGNGLTKVERVEADGSLSEVGGADFTNWPQVQGAHNHSVGFDEECAEEMTYRTSLREEGEVAMVQNEETGWFIEYTC
ncbi:hypothetical protein FQN55_007750 [Onygenales sp. PD_40]|nr:hypothetical protein FQN55_007750 [Onygenales sp. PD_40]KAK2775380.1 hypothetical protein FQN53_003167 [Emmonsiellopsis sp. PD_33]KAK2787275.1 hypothetical protein FQN51_003435 [Onygenales sp. PD_10]KAK2792623.1 hypothetical protein FQN52_003128 [Onygenales sp. PD_12]